MATTVWLAPVLTAALVMFSSLTLSADQEKSQKQVYGRQLMTEQERAEHHARMRAAKTQQERELIRKQQHERMKERASERGLSMADEPPAKSARKGDHKRHDGGGKGY